MTSSRYRLLAADSGRPIAERVEVARSFFARGLGLMFRRALDGDAGLYLPGTNSVTMAFMRFPIDCLFVGAATADGSQPVVGLRHNLLPWRGVVWYVRGAKGVVELPAGALEAAGINVGDRVRLEATGG